MPIVFHEASHTFHLANAAMSYIVKVLPSGHLGQLYAGARREQIAFYKRWRELLQFGTFYRLLSPFEGNEVAWMVVSADRHQAIVGYYRILQEVNAAYRRVRLAGLDPDVRYAFSGTDLVRYGDELMNVGLITTDSSSGAASGAGDFFSRIFVLEAR